MKHLKTYNYISGLILGIIITSCTQKQYSVSLKEYTDQVVFKNQGKITKNMVFSKLKKKGLYVETDEEYRYLDGPDYLFEIREDTIIDPPSGMRSSVPLGGFGAGSVELRADGRFMDWDIFNNSPATGNNKVQLTDALLGLWVQADGEAAMINGGWTKEKPRVFENTHDKTNVWTGLEYEASCDMINEGLLEEAFVSIRSIHDRYDGTKRNPWNEIEGSDHYSRAMHSWNVLLSLSGFIYDGPAGKIGFAPKITPNDFKCFFSGAEGWGTVGQKIDNGQQRETISVQWGSLRLKQLNFKHFNNPQSTNIKVTVNGKSITYKSKVLDDDVVISLDSELVLEKGQQIVVDLN